MGIYQDIASGKFQNIIVLTGAGISTNSNIPDYRSNQGLFIELMKDFPEIQQPEQLLSRKFFEQFNINENPTYQKHINLIKESTPTQGHYLCKWLNDQGWLRRVYTQNIDGLHQKAGLPDGKIIEFHGSLLSENVVLYGDEISSWVIEQIQKDFDEKVDCICILGTSLQVSPFCALPNLVSKKCVRILVDRNPENCMKNTWNNKNMASTIKIGKRIVSLKSMWMRYMDVTNDKYVKLSNASRCKWKNQYVIEQDIDEFSKIIME